MGQVRHPSICVCEATKADLIMLSSPFLLHDMISMTLNKTTVIETKQADDILLKFRSCAFGWSWSLLELK